VEIIEKSE